MNTARLEMRLDREIKEKAERACTLAGYKSLSAYVSRIIEEDADRIIAERSTVTVTNRRFDDFVSACAKASEPGAELKKALAHAKRTGIR